MATYCKNCGQPALETDTVCWHCGWLLPKVKPEPGVSVPSVEVEQRPLPLPGIAAASGLTLVIIMALLFVMNNLGRQPLYVQSLGVSLKQGWMAVTNQNQAFTLNLPPGWHWFDRQNDGQEAALIDLVRQDEQFQLALSPYAAIVNDRRLLLLALANQADEVVTGQPFVIVARSQQLGLMSPPQMARLLAEEPAGINLIRSSLAERASGRQQATFILTIPGVNGALHCQHLFLKAEDHGYLVVACANVEHYSDFSNDFHDILASFHLLSS